jgi:hypothetical protein
MSKVIGAVVTSIAHGIPRIEVKLDTPIEYTKFRYECVDDIYRAQLGDVVSFFAYSSPGRGFGGSVIKIKMLDGSDRQLYGPWSSRASVVNHFYPNHDACIEAVDGHCSISVTILSLLKLGLRFKPTKPEPIDQAFEYLGSMPKETA